MANPLLGADLQAELPFLTGIFNLRIKEKFSFLIYYSNC